jgi:hypothetical protein
MKKRPTEKPTEQATGRGERQPPDPEAPGNYVDDTSTESVPEPNEPA